MISNIILVIIGALVVSAFSSVAITRFNESQRTVAGNFTLLSAEDVMAYRWNAMAKFYANDQAAAFHYGPPGR